MQGVRCATGTGSGNAPVPAVPQYLQQVKLLGMPILVINDTVPAAGQAGGQVQAGRAGRQGER